MLKWAAMSAILVLAGCSATPTSYINVATGVDTNGNVIFERYPVSGRKAPEAAQSLSTFNPFTGKY